METQHPITLRELIDQFDLSLTSPREKARKEELREFRIRSAEEVLERLVTGNVGLVADTGTGKTIIAFLAFFFLYVTENRRTLFLAPQRLLTEQHKLLLGEIARASHIADAERIVGGRRKRPWKDRTVPIVFATPQTFMRDAEKGLVAAGDFDLVVLDEFHHATGKYDYVSIAARAAENGVRMLHLSASPGGTVEKIEAIEKACHIDHWVRVKIATPAKHEVIAVAEADPTVAELDRKFLSLLDRVEVQLRAFGVIDGPKRGRKRKPRLLCQHDLDVLIGKIRALEAPYPLFEALSLYAIYGKLRHAYLTCMTESYATFLAYLKREREKDDEDQTSSAGGRARRTARHRFLAHPRIREIEAIAERERDRHPKVAELERVVRGCAETKKNMLIFVGERETGLYLKEVLARVGVAAETIFGGREKNARRQEEVLGKLREREIDFVIATSVLKEGINIEKLDAVAHYSLPLNEIERIQGSGRAGRTEDGSVFYIFLDHPLEKARYWNSYRKLKTMNAVIEEKIAPHWMFEDRKMPGQLTFAFVSPAYDPAYP